MLVKNTYVSRACKRYWCCFAAVVFQECSVDPRTGNNLMSPEFTLVSDQELTFTMEFLPFFNYSSVSVYKTSMLGSIATLLGSYTSPWDSSAAMNITHTICLPAGTYQLVFIASEVENATESTAVLRQVLLSNSSCTYTSLAGTVLSFRYCQPITISWMRHSYEPQWQPTSFSCEVTWSFHRI